MDIEATAKVKQLAYNKVRRRQRQRQRRSRDGGNINSKGEMIGTVRATDRDRGNLVKRES